MKVEEFEIVKVSGRYIIRAVGVDHEDDAYGEFKTRAMAKEFLADFVAKENVLDESTRSYCNE